MKYHYRIIHKISKAVVFDSATSTEWDEFDSVERTFKAQDTQEKAQIFGELQMELGKFNKETYQIETYPVSFNPYCDEGVSLVNIHGQFLILELSGRMDIHMMGKSIWHGSPKTASDIVEIKLSDEFEYRLLSPHYGGLNSDILRIMGIDSASKLIKVVALAMRKEEQSINHKNLTIVQCFPVQQN